MKKNPPLNRTEDNFFVERILFEREGVPADFVHGIVDVESRGGKIFERDGAAVERERDGFDAVFL